MRMSRRTPAALGTVAALLAWVALAGCAHGTPAGADGPGGAAAAGRPTGPVTGTVWRELQYAPESKAERLDLYRPPHATGTLPLVVDIHGGGFAVGDKEDSAELVIVNALLARGFAVASLNYRMSDEARFPAGVQDVKAAIRWLRAHAGTYGLDPDRFGAVGESAGGYMSVMLATTASSSAFDNPALADPTVSSAVQAVADWWGPIDFTAMDSQFSATPSCKGKINLSADPGSPYSRWLGAPIPMVPDRVRAADPTTYLASTPSLPPILIEHGRDDCTVPFQQSEDLATALRTVPGANVTLHIVPNAGHGLDFPIVKRLPGIVAFFVGVLQPPR
jgi:acetyl esterase/lipase